MAENNQETARGRKVLKRVGLTASALGMAATLGSVETRPVSADTPTPTATTTITRTVTPSPTITPSEDQRIAALQTVVAEAVKKGKRQGLEAEATALAQPSTITPTITPTVDLTASARYRAGLRATATAKAGATQTAVTKAQEAAQAELSNKQNEKNKQEPDKTGLIWQIPLMASIVGGLGYLFKKVIDRRRTGGTP